MTKKHLIALDLDGTLLTDNKTISDNSKKMIRTLIDQGHIVVIATGRSKRVTMNYYHELGLSTPVVNSNGAFMHHPFDKSWKTQHLPLTLDTAMEIVEASKYFQSKNILANVQDNIYLDTYDKEIANFYGFTQTSNEFIVGDIKDSLKAEPTGMLLYPEEQYLPELTAKLNQLDTELVDHRNWGAPFHVIEVLNIGANKGEAIKQLAEQYNIPQERIMAFGDGGNDLEMIDYAGVGVAMENAVSELKNLATHHTATNEEHGVAGFLADYFKLKDSLVI
ncbi:MAG TPA: Cof-type HAD-IIB family hydrolase [Pseudogracilibacillus sp.]|nr:Cof-type HAD-IIB family hydrolase [Pseudogracilibacillus sp.]